MLEEAPENAPQQKANIEMPRHDVISLEEELKMHEATLQNLVRRQQALNVEEARRQQQAHVERLRALKTRRETLEETRQKHLGLQREIAEALAKSQERLARVLAAAPQEEDDPNSVTEEDVDEAVVLEVIKEEQTDNTESDDRVETVVPNLHLNEDVMANFLKTHGESGLAVFLTCLNSADLIQRIMNVTALETLALDQSQPEGNHRQESLWRTCLDFLCTAGKVASGDVSSPPAEESDEASTTETDQNGDAAIDPNVALCPYELTGECADPFCPYQHIKPRTTSAQILAREKLPLPTLKLPATPSATSTDALFPVQETEESPPASPLRKRKRTEKEDEESVQTQPLAEEVEEGSVQTQVLSENEEPENGANDDDRSESQGDGHVAMAWNDDFVSLPPASEPTEEEEDSALDSHSTEQVDGDQDDVANAEDRGEISIQQLWWHTDDDIARMKKSSARLSTLRLSLTDWLELVGGFQAVHASNDTGVASLVIKCSGYPTSSLEAVASLGRVVDCVRLCVHAGRFDLTHALCTYAQRSLSEAFASTNDAEASDKHDKIGCVLRKAVECLETARDTVFNFNSDWRTALCCAFEAEISMATLENALKMLYEGLGSVKGIDAWLEKWPKILEQVFTLLSANTIEDVSSECQDASHRPENVVDVIQNGRSVMASLKQRPMEEFVDEILKPTLSTIREFSDKLKDDGLEPQSVLFLYTQGYIILGCAQSACARIASGGDQGFDASATLTAIDSCIYQSVTCLTNIASAEPLAELCLAPLYALSVSLASTLRRYGKAQRRLEAALHVLLAKGRSALSGGYLIYSELLWSQLIQLRSSLPLLSDSDNDKRAVSLSSDTRLEHKSIATTANAFGVHPNHVTLCGDWNMLKAFDVDSRKHASLAHVRKYCHALFPALFSQPRQGGSSIFCNLWHLPLTEVDMPTRMATVRSLAFPRSTLLAGRDLSVLVANKCNLKQLPVTFGIYFPNLKVSLCYACCDGFACGISGVALCKVFIS